MSGQNTSAKKTTNNVIEIATVLLFMHQQPLYVFDVIKTDLKAPVSAQ